MNLLVLAEGFPYGSNTAGNFHREQFRLLAAEMSEMTVVVPVPWVPPLLKGRSQRWDSYAMLPSRQVEDGFKVLRPRYLALPGENKRYWPDLTRYTAVRSLQLPRPDMILSYFAVPTGAVAQRLAEAWKVPYAVGMLGDDVNIYPKQNSRNLRLLKSVLKNAAYCFANGPTLAKTAEALTGLKPDVLSLGASRAKFARRVPRDEARRALGWPATGIFGLYVGALTETKGVLDLQCALDFVSEDVRIQVIGSGPLLPHLEKHPKLRCLGPRQPDDVALAMFAADFLVHPSHYEGLPTVIVEAGFARLPVITTDAPGCIDLGAEGRAEIASVGDAHMLAAAMTRMISDRESAKAMAERMFQHVSESYDLSTNTAKLARILRDKSRGQG